MYIKSLLLGSAAALVAVSGARAADAVMAEPEPVEYVKVCDAYGAGFYYIPGTETCLRVGGYLQYDIGAGEVLGLHDILDKRDLGRDGDINFNDSYFARTRFELQVDARSETELGTLRGYAAIRFDYADVEGDISSTSATGFSVNQGYIELGGFRVGRSDSLFTTFTGYAGNVINDTFYGLAYGPFDTNQIVYTYTGGNGFTAAIGVEEGDGDTYTIDSYAPHVVGGIGFTQSWGGITAVAGYDSVYEEWAAKVRVDVKINDAFSLFAMGGYKSGAHDDDYGAGGGLGAAIGATDKFGDDNPNYYGQWAGDWIIFAGGSYKFSDKASFNVQAAYNEDDDFSVVADVAYTLVPGLTITPEIAYVSYDGDSGNGNDDSVNGWLRFRRSF